MKLKLIVGIAGMGGLLALGAACSNGEASIGAEPADGGSSTAATGAPAAPAVEDQPTDPLSAVASTVTETGGSANGSGGTAPAPAVVAERASTVPAVASSYAGAYQTAAASGQAGIWVSGEGTIDVEPDLALLNMGVETTGDTVAEARAEAAVAMDAVVAAVKAHGLVDRDIQTTSFNIWPLYDYQEVFDSGKRVSKQVLIGYRVSNSAAIKIRDLDEVGEIIDNVADAGGDSTRINGIRFTVEDPKPLMVGLRAAAVDDALEKALQFAALAQVELGSLVYIAESTGGSVMQSGFDSQVRAEMAFAVAAPASSISGGELQLRLSIQAVFEIR